MNLVKSLKLIIGLRTNPPFLKGGRGIEAFKLILSTLFKRVRGIAIFGLSHSPFLKGARGIVSIILFSVLLTACSSTPEYLSPQELNKFILAEENGLKKVTEINGYRIEVINRPTDLWVHQEVGDEPVAEATLTQLRKKYSTYYYFIVSLSKNNKEALHQLEGGMGQYSELVQTLSFRMADYANLTTSAQDTIPVGDAMLNRTYGLSASTDLLFVFNKTKAEGKDWVQFNLNEFGMGVGNQRFRFKTKDIETVPQIDFVTIPSANNRINTPTN
jgi:hypothetical protein